jgi:hypothetical protein
MIKKSLDKFIDWAAEDGGYSHLQYTPNISVEIIDSVAEESDLTGVLEARMRALARSHRELLAMKPEEQDVTSDMDIDKEVEMQIKSEVEAVNEQRQQLSEERSRSWRTFGSRIMGKLLRMIRSRPVIKLESHGETSVIDSEDDDRTTIEQDHQAMDRVYVKTEEEEEEKYSIKEEYVDDSDDDILMEDIPLAPTAVSLPSLPPLPPSPSRYLRPPPVIYGLFIVTSTVLLFTADSSKDEPSMNLSFHLDLDFQDRGQSVWNALTVAIVACLARDDMMTRMEDFEEERVVEESDVDA